MYVAISRRPKERKNFGLGQKLFLVFLPDHRGARCKPLIREMGKNLEKKAWKIKVIKISSKEVRRHIF